MGPMPSQIEWEWFVRIKFETPIEGRQGCAVIVGAPNLNRAKEIALIGQPPGSQILDVWSRAE